ncbi:MAG: DUF4175 family protein [Bacteroidota bacterium]
MSSSLQETYKKLHSVIEKEKRRDGLNNLFIFLIAGSIFVLMTISFESLANFNSGVRTFLFLGLIIGALIFLFIYLIYPILKDLIYYAKPDYVQTAIKIGLYFPEIKDELANAIQLMEDKSTLQSGQLIEAAFSRIYKKAANQNFNSVVNFDQTKKLFRISLSALLITFLLITFIPTLNSAAYRLLKFSYDFTPPAKFRFLVLPGSIEATKGDNIRIKVQVLGKQQTEIFLLTKSVEETDYTIHPLRADSAGIFNFEIPSIKNSMIYYASHEGVVSNQYEINVINRPIITYLEAQITQPAYTGLPTVIQKDNGNITALPGSRVNIKIGSSRELKSASINFSDSTEVKMESANLSAVTSFKINKNAGYQILLEDEKGNSNINPVTYTINTLIDESPSIEMISPNKNVKLGTDGKISLVMKIADDYGFGSLNLNYTLSASRYRQTSEAFTRLPLSFKKDAKEDEIYYAWDLMPLYLAEGEMITYYAEVFDNDNVNGPKSSRTEMFTILVPSLDELFAQADNSQEESAGELNETLKEAEKLNSELQKISDDLKQNTKEISWQEKERIEKAAEKFKELTNKIDDVSQKLSEMKNDLAHNNLFSEETLQKYNELQDLLDEFNSEELKEAFRRLQESLQNLSRDNVQMSLEELKANEEYFKKSIERTLNLLKRVQVEQKVDELIKRTEDISNKLEELGNKTEQNNLNDKNKRDELAKRQSNLTEDLKNLQNEMDKLSEKMNELSDMPQDQLNKLKEEFEKQHNEQLSKETKEMLEQMQKFEAMKNQQQLSQNIDQTGKQLQSLQTALQQMNQVQTFYDMMKILDDLLTLSKEQENLRNNTDQLGPNSPQLGDNSRKQNEIQNNLGKILNSMGTLSQKSFSITPEMGRALGEANSQMQQSINSMQNKNPALSSQQQGKAMSSLNEAANLLKGAMDRMMSGGEQGGGMMSMMQQLQQLSQQQMNLNQLTQMLNQGRIPQEMAAQMQRLAQQQELIRKSLDQMNQEAKESGESKKLAANLEKILDEMKEVVTNLQTEKIDDELVKQQEKILSRMLDAQRSINERDFERDRKSNTGKNISQTSPPELILSTEEGKNKLKDELMKAIREGYKKDYEELIRKYFEMLEKTEKK